MFTENSTIIKGQPTWAFQHKSENLLKLDKNSSYIDKVIRAYIDGTS